MGGSFSAQNKWAKVPATQDRTSSAGFDSDFTSRRKNETEKLRVEATPQNNGTCKKEGPIGSVDGHAADKPRLLNHVSQTQDRENVHSLGRTSIAAEPSKPSLQNEMPMQPQNCGTVHSLGRTPIAAEPSKPSLQKEMPLLMVSNRSTEDDDAILFQMHPGGTRGHASEWYTEQAPCSKKLFAKRATARVLRRDQKPRPADAIGAAILVYPESDQANHHYAGETRENKRHGRGVLWKRDGGLIKGQFANDEVHGFAIDVCKGEGTYSGQFARNQRHGLGELKREDGTWFLGGWRAGRRSEGGVTDESPQSAQGAHFETSLYFSLGLQDEGQTQTSSGANRPELFDRNVSQEGIIPWEVPKCEEGAEEKNWENVSTQLQGAVERAHAVAEDAWTFVQDRFGAYLPVPEATQAPHSPVQASQCPSLPQPPATSSVVSSRLDAASSSVACHEDSASSFVSFRGDAVERKQTKMWLTALESQGDMSPLNRRSVGQPSYFSKACVDACLLWASTGQEGQSQTLETHLEAGDQVPYWRVFPAKGMASDSDTEGSIYEESHAGVSGFEASKLWHRSAALDGTCDVIGPCGQARQQAEWDAAQERTVLGATWAELQATEADSELYFRQVSGSC